MLDLKKLSGRDYTVGLTPSALYFMSKDPQELISRLGLDIPMESIESNLRANLSHYRRSRDFDKWLRPYIGAFNYRAPYHQYFSSARISLRGAGMRIHPNATPLECLSILIILGATRFANTSDYKKFENELSGIIPRVVSLLPPPPKVGGHSTLVWATAIVEALTEEELNRIISRNLALYPRRGRILNTQGAEFTRSCLRLLLEYVDKHGG